MPTSTNINRYPPGMLDVLEAVCETEKSAVIAYVNDKTAKAERLKFYGLIRALKVNKHSLMEKAARLSINLSGERNRLNILTISYPAPADSDVYAAIAASIYAANTPATPAAITLKDDAAARQDDKEPQ